ncbi:MAG: 3-oxoacyl-[acyl-carrier-protein] synthase III C-terminal domain-containing protein [Alphaproteobacteria bacterium]
MASECPTIDSSRVSGASPAALLGLGTAVPPCQLDQRDIATIVRGLFAERYPDFERLVSVFYTAGIARRHIARPPEWYMQPRHWPDRMEAYVEGAEPLFIEAAEKALSAAGLAASEVDTIVTISSTGIATPSLEARVAGIIGFRPDVSRVPVFGLGCAGGAAGLSLAARLAEARPGTNVLMVAVELCSLAFRLDQLSKANIVATALFADGAAAAVVRAGAEGLCRIEAAAEHTWPDSLNIMGWTVDPEGLGVIFDREIPPFAERHFGPAVEGMLARMGLAKADVGRFCCHPGGSKVIQALETTLDLERRSLDHERAVLADYGNMSSPTVLFVLERLLQAGLPERTILTALGPGFSAQCVSLARHS